MTDGGQGEALRTLERAVASGDADPERLQDERVRRGLGWHGEELPDGLVPSERGVYTHQARGTQLVYVPGGEGACRTCGGAPGRRFYQPGDSDPRICLSCHGSGSTHVAPLYIGRFPVTLNEYLHADGMARASASAEDLRPATGVTLEVASGFCRGIGLRLPTETEWRWAALGPKWATASYPWGDEPPGPDRCAIAQFTSRGPPAVGSVAMVGGQREAWSCRCGAFWRFDAKDGDWLACAQCRAGLSKKVTKDGPVVRLVPARPTGASWCGAHDMLGNVWQLVEREPESPTRSPGTTRTLALGASWKSDHGSLMASLQSNYYGLGASDDIGFRAALSARSP